MFAELLWIKTGDTDSKESNWKIKTKYYEANIEIVQLEFVPAFIDEELQDLGKVDCIFYEFSNEENFKDFVEGIHKL